MDSAIRIGTAGWSIPKGCADAFAGEGSHLKRYARRFPVVEINSSFYRPHKPATYARWSASVPAPFRFAVKMPREITHSRKLADFAEPLETFLSQIGHLGERLGPVLVQLPPSLGCDPGVAVSFFTGLRARFDGHVVFEPRHPSWFDSPVDAMLRDFEIARVAADPPPVPAAAEPGGWPQIVYLRLHGSPDIYYSAYSGEDLAATATRLLAFMATPATQAWCIFDNTARGAACENALSLQRLLQAA